MSEAGVHMGILYQRWKAPATMTNQCVCVIIRRQRCISVAELLSCGYHCAAKVNVTIKLMSRVTFLRVYVL
jgi:hypothetical protein